MVNYYRFIITASSVIQVSNTNKMMGSGSVALNLAFKDRSGVIMGGDQADRGVQSSPVVFFFIDVFLYYIYYFIFTHFKQKVIVLLKIYEYNE